jgi:hypothetical protein
MEMQSRSAPLRDYRCAAETASAGVTELISTVRVTNARPRPSSSRGSGIHRCNRNYFLMNVTVPTGTGDPFITKCGVDAFDVGFFGFVSRSGAL